MENNIRTKESREEILKEIDQEFEVATAVLWKKE